MKGLLPLSLALAALATAALGLLAFRRGGAAPVATPPAEAPRAPGPPAPGAEGLRPYQTTATLTEDLRDALAGDPSALDAECWRVSRALAGRAGWMLEQAAPAEASPRVRALLVLACGVHEPDGGALLAFLADRAPVVREAAALAAGHRRGCAVEARLLGDVRVPLGRAPAPATVERLRARLLEEEDEGVQGAVKAVLGAAGVPLDAGGARSGGGGNGGGGGAATDRGRSTGAGR